MTQEESRTASRDLAFSQPLVLLGGGEIHAESEGPGHGSRFPRLPLRAAPDALANSRANDQGRTPTDHLSTTPPSVTAQGHDRK